jgi:hypothetical protein
MTSGLAARLAPLSLVLFVASVAGYASLARQSLAAAPFSFSPCPSTKRCTESAS